MMRLPPLPADILRPDPQPKLDALMELGDDPDLSPKDALYRFIKKPSFRRAEAFGKAWLARITSPIGQQARGSLEDIADLARPLNLVPEFLAGVMELNRRAPYPQLVQPPRFWNDTQSEKSAQVVRSLFRGQVGPAEAYQLLTEGYEKRPIYQQLVYGVIDPTNLVPLTLPGKVIGKLTTTAGRLFRPLKPNTRYAFGPQRIDSDGLFATPKGWESVEGRPKDVAPRLGPIGASGGKSGILRELDYALKGKIINPDTHSLTTEWVRLIPDKYLARFRVAFPETLDPGTFGRYYADVNPLAVVSEAVVRARPDLAPRTIIHEISHHLSRFIPEEDVIALREQWAKDVADHGIRLVNEAKSGKLVAAEGMERLMQLYRFTEPFNEWVAEVLTDKALVSTIAQLPEYKPFFQQIIDIIRPLAMAMYNRLMRTGEADAAQNVYDSLLAGKYPDILRPTTPSSALVQPNSEFRFGGEVFRTGKRGEWTGPQPGIPNVRRMIHGEIPATGKLAFIERLALEMRKGNIDPDTRELVGEWVSLVPAKYLRNLATSFPQVIRRKEPTAGLYTTDVGVSPALVQYAARFLAASPEFANRTLIHEVMHHLSRFVPKKQVDAMQAQWQKDLADNGKRVIDEANRLKGQVRFLTKEEEEAVELAYRYEGGFVEWIAEVLTDNALAAMIIGEMPGYKPIFARIIDLVRRLGMGIYNFLLRRNPNAAAKVYRELIAGEYPAIAGPIPGIDLGVPTPFAPGQLARSIPVEPDIQDILTNSIHSAPTFKRIFDWLGGMGVVRIGPRTPLHPRQRNLAGLLTGKVSIELDSRRLFEPLVDFAFGRGVLGRPIKRLAQALHLAYSISHGHARLLRLSLEREAEPFLSLIGDDGLVNVRVLSPTSRITSRWQAGWQGVVSIDDLARSPGVLLELNRQQLVQHYDFGPNQGAVLDAIERLQDAANQIITRVETRTGQTWLQLTGHQKQHYFPRLVESLADTFIRGREASPIPILDYQKQFGAGTGAMRDREIHDSIEAWIYDVRYFSPMDALEVFMASAYRFAVDSQADAVLAPLAVKNTAQSASKHFDDMTLYNQAINQRIAGANSADIFASYPQFANDPLFQRIANTPPTPDFSAHIKGLVELARQQVAYLSSIRHNTFGMSKLIFDDETYKAIRTTLEEEKLPFYNALHGVSSTSNLAKFAMTGLDPSILLIQAVPLMVTKPAIFANGALTWFRSLFDSRLVDQFLINNAGEVEELWRYGGVQPGADWNDYLIRPGLVQKVVSWLPGARNFERAYAGMMLQARVHLWASLKHLAKNESDKYDIAQYINKITGSINPDVAGMSRTNRMIENTLVSFAYGYRRAVAALILDTMQGGIRGSLARTTMMRLMAAGLLTAAASWMWLKEKDTPEDMQEVLAYLSSPKLMSFRVGDQHIGWGTAFTSLFRASINITRQSIEHPDKLLTLDPRDNQFVRFWRSQAPPIPSYIMDVIRGRNYIGERLADEDNNLWTKEFALHTLKRLTPMATESLWEEGFSRGSWVTFVDWFGLRSFPVSEYERLAELRADVLALDNAPQVVAWRKANPEGKWAELPKLLQIDLTNRYATLDQLDRKVVAGRVETGDQEQRLLGEFQQALRARDDQMQPFYTGLAQEWTSGTIDSTTFRQQKSTLDSQRAALTASIYRDPKFTSTRLFLDEAAEKRAAEGDTFILDLAYDRYQRDVANNPVIRRPSGILNSSVYKRLLSDFRTFFGEETYKYVRSRQAAQRNFPPPIASFELAQQELEPYWDLHNKVLSPGDALTFEEYQSSPDYMQDWLLKAKPRLRYLIRRMSRERDKYKRAHSAHDWLLVKWYGHSPRSPANRRRLLQLTPNQAIINISGTTDRELTQ
jgi:hypothetical protein